LQTGQISDGAKRLGGWAREGLEGLKGSRSPSGRPGTPPPPPPGRLEVGDVLVGAWRDMTAFHLMEAMAGERGCGGRDMPGRLLRPGFGQSRSLRRASSLADRKSQLHPTALPNDVAVLLLPPLTHLPRASGPPTQRHSTPPPPYRCVRPAHHPLRAFTRSPHHGGPIAWPGPLARPVSVGRSFRFRRSVLYGRMSSQGATSHDGEGPGLTGGNADNRQ
jgi:hypothetical protein